MISDRQLSKLRSSYCYPTSQRFREGLHGYAVELLSFRELEFRLHEFFINMS